MKSFILKSKKGLVLNFWMRSKDNNSGNNNDNGNKHAVDDGDYNNKSQSIHSRSSTVNSFDRNK